MKGTPASSAKKSAKGTAKKPRPRMAREICERRALKGTRDKLVDVIGFLRNL